MVGPKVFFVHLPPESASKNPDEQRDDPFYEVGSFGCTKCHSKNFLHPNHADELRGARLAFVQGGQLGSRLVFLTPPVTVKVWKNNCEVRWTPAEMPFKYKEAPVLVSNVGQADFRLVKQFALESDGTKIEGRFCSKIRSKAKPLKPKLAHEVVKVYEEKLRRKRYLRPLHPPTTRRCPGNRRRLTANARRLIGSSPHNAKAKLTMRKVLCTLNGRRRKLRPDLGAACLAVGSGAAEPIAAPKSADCSLAVAPSRGAGRYQGIAARSSSPGSPRFPSRNARSHPR